jgi:tripartite-type tricarboxylate transporter receptor subunit TctC
MQEQTMRRFASTLLAAFLSVLAVPAGAQGYPARPIRFVVPFAPGGGNDIIARIVAEGLTHVLGKQVIVDNRGGAASILGTEIVAKAAPDGYTLLNAGNSTVFNVALYQKLPYDTLRDFTPITLLADQPNLLVAHPSLPAKTLQEFLVLARSHPRKFTYGSSGIGGGTHLAMELLLMSQKVEVLHVPYKGTGPSLTALLGGEISAMLSTFASAMPHVKSGRLRAFAVTSAQRASVLPEVPTFAESGVPGYEYTTRYGMLAPAGTPRAIIEKLNQATVGVLNTHETRQKYMANGIDPMPSTSAAYAAYLKSEIEKWSKVIRAANIPPQ